MSLLFLMPVAEVLKISVKVLTAAVFISSTLIASVSAAGKEPITISTTGIHTLAHRFSSGPIKVLNEKQIKIDKIIYDGTGPAAWFAVGKGGKGYKTRRVDLRKDSNLTFIPDENQSCSRPKKYDGTKDITLTLPGSMKMTDIDFLVIFCIAFNANFGYVEIPKDLAGKMPVADAKVPMVKACSVSKDGSGMEIGRSIADTDVKLKSSTNNTNKKPLTISSSGFHNLTNDLHSAEIKILNEKQIEIQNLKFPDEGSADSAAGGAETARFAVGKGGMDYKIKDVSLKGITFIPDEQKSCDNLKQYNGTENIKLTLPGSMKVIDITYLVIFSNESALNFGYVEIPKTLSLALLPAAGPDVPKVEACASQ